MAVTFMSRELQKPIPTTPQQRQALKSLDERWWNVEVWPKSFDLPDEYISIVLIYSNGDKIYGGISPEGEVST